MTLDLRRMYVAHVEWLGKRKSLTGQPKRHFYRWVLEEHPELATPFTGKMQIFRQQCLEVQRGSSMPTKRGLGMATLKRYAEPLTRHYLSLSEDEQITFAEFLDQVVSQCPTERSLKRFLGLTP